MAFISVVIPLYDEIDNILPLCTALSHALGDADAEVIIVDDGSRDGSAAALDREAEARGARFKVIHLQRNEGQRRFSGHRRKGLRFQRRRTRMTRGDENRRDASFCPGLAFYVDLHGSHCRSAGAPPPAPGRTEGRLGQSLR